MTPEEEQALRQEVSDLRRQKEQREERMRQALDDLRWERAMRDKTEKKMRQLLEGVRREFAPLLAQLEAGPEQHLGPYEQGWADGHDYAFCKGKMEILEKLLGESSDE